MKGMQKLAAAGIAATALLAQTQTGELPPTPPRAPVKSMARVTGAKPSPLGPKVAAPATLNETSAAPEEHSDGPAQQQQQDDLYAAELANAQRAESEWNKADANLDQAIAAAAPCKAIEPVADAQSRKTSAIRLWEQYYRSWLRKYEEIGRLTDGMLVKATKADLIASLQMTERERNDLHRRKADLVQAVQEKGLKADPRAMSELNGLLEMADMNLRKLRTAVEWHDKGVGYMQTRRDLAKQRQGQMQAMLNSMSVEGRLYDSMYSGMQHKENLACDVTQKPQGSPDTQSGLTRAEGRLKGARDQR